MKIWALMGASAAVAMLSAAACTVEVSDDDDSAGGAGGAGGTASQGGSGGTTSQGGSGGSGGSGGTGQGGGGPSCDTCNGFITADANTPLANQFCGENPDLTCEPNTSCESFALLYDCVCEGSGQGGGGAGGGGTCAAECQATLCNIQPLDVACENCLINDLGNTCGDFYGGCLAD